MGRIRMSGKDSFVTHAARYLVVLVVLVVLGAMLGDTPYGYFGSRVVAADGESSEWMFNKGLYTNDNKTGQRVKQYADNKAAYRDPNAIYNSAHGPYPFVSNFYDPYRYYGHRPYGPSGGANPLGPYPHYGPKSHAYSPYPFY